MAEALNKGRVIRLVKIIALAADESLALLNCSETDLGVARGDLEMPSNVETVAVVSGWHYRSNAAANVGRNHLRPPIISKAVRPG